MPRQETVLQRFDRSPSLLATLYDPNGEPEDLTGATAVTIYMRRRKPRTVKIAAGVATILDAANGRIEYPWAAADTNEPGVYDLWVKVDRAGSIESFPSSDSHVVRIQP